jgi:hypothetical protein
VKGFSLDFERLPCGVIAARKAPSPSVRALGRIWDAAIENHRDPEVAAGKPNYYFSLEKDYS